MFGHITQNIPIRSNLSEYVEKDEILKSLFLQETNSYKLANAMEWVDIYKNSKGEQVARWKNKLIKLVEDEKISPGKTIMVFENSEELNKLLTSDFSINSGRYGITKDKDCVFNDKTSVMLYSLEDFNKIIDKIYEDNLTIVFDNTYYYYINLIKKNEELFNLLFNDKQDNIHFFFLSNI